jgi:hypothetical protein
MLKSLRPKCASMPAMACVIALTAFSISAQVVPGSQTVATTGMVGIADAQTAQLNLLNPGVLPPALGAICTALVTFVDDTGTVIKSTTLSVPPGKSLPFTLRSDTDLNLVAGDRREIRATISIPAIITPAATASPAATPACKVIPTLEMLDTVSGRTLVVLGHAVMVPSVVATPQ